MNVTIKYKVPKYFKYERPKNFIYEIDSLDYSNDRPKRRKEDSFTLYSDEIILYFFDLRLNTYYWDWDNGVRRNDEPFSFRNNNKKVYEDNSVNEIKSFYKGEYHKK